MYITLTSSVVTDEQSGEVEKFLAEFLPRLKRQPGVLEIYHFKRPELDEEVTAIIWEDEQAMKAYRESELVKEPMAFERQHNLPSQRRGYPLIYATSRKS